MAETPAEKSARINRETSQKRQQENQRKVQEQAREPRRATGGWLSGRKK